MPSEAHRRPQSGAPLRRDSRQGRDRSLTGPQPHGHLHEWHLQHGLLPRQRPAGRHRNGVRQGRVHDLCLLPFRRQERRRSGRAQRLPSRARPRRNRLLRMPRRRRQHHWRRHPRPCTPCEWPGRPLLPGHQRGVRGRQLQRHLPRVHPHGAALGGRLDAAPDRFRCRRPARRRQQATAARLPHLPRRRPHRRRVRQELRLLPSGGLAHQLHLLPRRHRQPQRRATPRPLRRHPGRRALFPGPHRPRQRPTHPQRLRLRAVSLQAH